MFGRCFEHVCSARYGPQARIDEWLAACLSLADTIHTIQMNRLLICRERCAPMANAFSFSAVFGEQHAAVPQQILSLVGRQCRLQPCHLLQGQSNPSGRVPWASSTNSRTKAETCLSQQPLVVWLEEDVPHPLLIAWALFVRTSPRDVYH